MRVLQVTGFLFVALPQTFGLQSYAYSVENHA